MWLKDYFSLLYVLAIWGASRLQSGRFFLSKYAKIISISLIILVTLFLFYITRSQFLLWMNNEVSKYLIPPYSTISYFLKYSLYRFWLPYIISLVIGLSFWWLAMFFNKKHGDIFFEKEELYFLFFSIFLNGHPGWILYLVIIFIFTLLYAIGHWLLAKRIRRISFYHWWLPLAIISIFLNKIILIYPWYNVLVFSM